VDPRLWNRIKLRWLIGPSAEDEIEIAIVIDIDQGSQPVISSAPL